MGYEIMAQVKLKMPSVAQMAKQAKKRPNPLDDIVEYTGDHELDSKNELKAIAGGISEYAKAIGDQRMAIENNNDTGFYTCLVAETREQLEEFFDKLGYHDGLPQIMFLEDFARLIGVEVSPTGFVPKKPKQDKKLLEITE